MAPSHIRDFGVKGMGSVVSVHILDDVVFMRSACISLVVTGEYSIEGRVQRPQKDVGQIQSW